MDEYRGFDYGFEKDGTVCIFHATNYHDWGESWGKLFADPRYKPGVTGIIGFAGSPATYDELEIAQFALEISKYKPAYFGMVAYDHLVYGTIRDSGVRYMRAKGVNVEVFDRLDALLQWTEEQQKNLDEGG